MGCPLGRVVWSHVQWLLWFHGGNITLCGEDDWSRPVVTKTFLLSDNSFERCKLTYTTIIRLYTL